MYIPLNQFEQFIDNTILERGLDYFRKGYVIDVEKITDDEYEAIVSGSGSNLIVVKIINEIITEHICDCSENNIMPICQHVVAVLYFLQDKEKITINNLLQEAYRVLEQSNQFSTEAQLKLGQVFNQIASWSGNHNPEEQYYEDFQNTILAMTQLDFTQRLALTSNIKSIQNFFSVAINTLNEKLQDKAISNNLLSNLLATFDIKRTILIGTDKDDVVIFFQTSEKTIPNIKGQKIDIFFDDFNGFIEKMSMKGFNGWLNVKLNNIHLGHVLATMVFPPSGESSNMILYAIKLPESNNLC